MHVCVATVSRHYARRRLQGFAQFPYGNQGFMRQFVILGDVPLFQSLGDRRHLFGERAGTLPWLRHCHPIRRGQAVYVIHTRGYHPTRLF